MRVLITGASGLLGVTLTEELRANGIEVIRHGRRSGDVVADLLDRTAARRLIAEVAPAAVVHLAALTNVDQCEQHPLQAYLSNTRVTENLVAGLVSDGKSPSPHLVHISTDQVYDGTGPHAEADVAITNYYAFSKYAAELVAATIGATVLRTNFFGRSRHPERASFSDWLVNAIRREEPLRVFDDVQFSPLSMERLAACIRIAVERRVAGTFNLGSHTGMSKADFCFALANALDLPTHTMTRALSTQTSLRAYRPKDMRMNSASFERAFDLELPTLQEEIESMKRYYHAVT